MRLLRTVGLAEKALKTVDELSVKLLKGIAFRMTVSKKDSEKYPNEVRMVFSMPGAEAKKSSES